MSIGSISAGYTDVSSLRAQFQQLQADRFAKDDTDGSGGLSIEEFTKAQENAPKGPAGISGTKSVEEIFASLDGDGDGEITQAEFEAARPSPPSGSFAPDTLASLLQAQEESGETSLLDLLQFGSSTTEEDSQSAILSQLLDSFSADVTSTTA